MTAQPHTDATNALTHRLVDKYAGDRGEAHAFARAFIEDLSAHGWAWSVHRETLPNNKRGKPADPDLVRALLPHTRAQLRAGEQE